MQCDELLGCSLDDRPKEQYKWWSTQKIFGKKCSTKTRNIEREKLDSTLFLSTEIKTVAKRVMANVFYMIL